MPAAPPILRRSRSAELVDALAHERQGLGDVGIALGWHGDDLRLVGRMLRHDHERGRSLAFDVELDAPKSVEGDVEGESSPGGHGQAPVRHDEACTARLGTACTVSPGSSCGIR